MKKILLPMLAATMMFTACENEQDVALEQTQQKGGTFTVPDFQNGENTRMAVDINASGANFTWTEGDTLGVFPSNGYQTAFPISGGAGTNTAVFDGADWALRPNASYAAYYPLQHPLDAIDKTAIPASYLGQTQNGNGSTAHLGAYDYLGAKYTTVSASGDVNFTLNHLGCLVRFQLTMPEADTYTNMTLSCDDKCIPTINSFDILSQGTKPVLRSKKKESSISLALNNISATEANQVLTLYMMLPPMDLTGENLTVTISGANEDYSAKIVSKNFNAGCIYDYTASLVAPTPPDNLAFVDLGVSVNWATFNLGASSPEEYGDYYAWGEIRPYYLEGHALDNPCEYWRNGKSEGYYIPSYKFCDGISVGSVIKYNNQDKKFELDPEDDAAIAHWGRSCHIPSEGELTEIINHCYWEWTDSYNGKSVAGYIVYKVKSDSDMGVIKNSSNSITTIGSYSLSDNHIFLPAAGDRIKKTFKNAGSTGYYWTSTRSSSSSPGYAVELNIKDGDPRLIVAAVPSGCSVRPVCPNPNFILATSIQISGSNTRLALPNTLQLSAAVAPSDATIASVTWTSSDEGVATVSADGLVTSVGEGTVTITATANDGSGVKATYLINVFLPVEPDANGYQYVDLGITDDNGNPIYWATCNLGASSPEEYGNYYAWGETKAYGEEDTSNATNYSYTSGQGSATYTKTYYNWSTYKYCNGSYSTQTKYCTNRNYGTVDNKTVLESADDAATANWGGNWRMPTDAELTKLRTKCTWTWTTQNSNKGYKVTGSNGNSIFLPAAGCRFESSLFDDGFYGFYGSSSLFSEDDDAYNLKFHLGYVFRGNNDRYCGQSIRPVCQ